MGTFLGIRSWNLESSLQSGGSQFKNVPESLERFLKTKSLDPTPRVVDSLGLRLGRRICAFNKFLADGDGIGQGATFSTTKLYELLLG